MRPLNALFSLVLLIGMALSGCQSHDSAVPAPTEFTPQVEPEFTSPVTATYTFTETVEALGPVVTESSTEAPVSKDEDLLVFEKLDCGEVFCQVAWPGIFIRPVALDNRSTIDLSYLYASTMDNTLDPHHGIEFLNAHGTPVLAASDGEVVFADEDIIEVFGPYPGFYGKVVILQHPQILDRESALFTLYGHLSAVEVEPGTDVRAGDVIGKIGASGWATGPHLHFEIRLGENNYEQTVNPILWFEPVSSFDAGESGMVAGTIRNYYGDPIPDLPLTLKKLADDGAYESYYYFSTYTTSSTNQHPVLQENFAFPDVPAGDYRLAFVSGRLHEIFFTLEPGSLGFIKFQFE